MIDIRSPRFSFVQLATAAYGYVPETYDTCNFPNVQFCLPVYAYDDIAFMFILQGTEEEADELCLLDNPVDKVKVGLFRTCGEDFDVDFSDAALYAQRVRISPTQVLYKWPHGFPGFDSEYGIGECFYLGVIVQMNEAPVSACSNCFQRIGEDCYTSLLEYGSEQNIFGFNYCDGGVEDEEAEICADPTIIEFTDALTLNIPYTVSMSEKYGQVPTVEIWIWDGSQYVKPFIQAGFDAYPPTAIIADLGGAATGFIKIS